jgi:hypothetical protein
LTSIYKGHAGIDIRIDRIGRPAITTGLAVQPDVLRGLANRPSFRGRGLLGRYLYSMPKDTLGTRKTKGTPVSRQVRDNYQHKIKSLLGLEPKKVNGVPEPHTLTFDQDAQAVMEGFVGWIEPKLADGGELGDMTDWAGKLAGAVARIAGILHIFDRAGEEAPWEHQIDADVVKRAIKIGMYLIPHAKYAMAFMGSDPAVEDAKYILRWIERGTVKIFTKRDALEGTKARFGKVSELENALELLVAHGYIREDPNQPQHRGPGRKPSPRYEVNPIFKSQPPSHNSHNDNLGGAGGDLEADLEGEPGEAPDDDPDGPDSPGGGSPAPDGKGGMGEYSMFTGSGGRNEEPDALDLGNAVHRGDHEQEQEGNHDTKRPTSARLTAQEVQEYKRLATTMGTKEARAEVLRRREETEGV